MPTKAINIAIKKHIWYSSGVFTNSSIFGYRISDNTIHIPKMLPPMNVKIKDMIDNLFFRLNSLTINNYFNILGSKCTI